MNNKQLYRRAIAAAVLLGLAAGVQADEYHYTNILIGDRASGMGGAYTAVSDDPSGLYYNPAGIAYARSSSLSASVNAYQTTNTTYKSALGGSRDWTRSSSSLLPNFFGIVQPLGKGVFGFSYAVPDNVSEDQDQVFSGFPSALSGYTINNYTINFNFDDATYKLGPSYAVALNERVSVGMTLYYHYRDMQFIQNEYVNLSDGTTELRERTSRYRESSEHGLQPSFGLMWSAGERLALGMMLSKNFIFDSQTNEQGSYSLIDHTQQEVLDDVGPSIVGHDDQREFPLQVRLGAAWFHSSRLLLSADLMHNTAHDYLFGGNTYRREAVTDMAVGAEYYLSNTLALRGGFYTSYANTPEIGPGSLNQEENVDNIGLTASISRYTRNSSLSFGMGYGMGSGRAQLFANNPRWQEVESSSLTVFLSTSYSY